MLRKRTAVGTRFFIGFLAILSAACAHQPAVPRPPEATTTKTLSLEFVLRLPPAADGDDPMNSSVSYDSMELFGPITEFAALDEEAVNYIWQQKTAAHAAGNDFCSWKIEGYRLASPCNQPVSQPTKPLAPDSSFESVIYGDFDGDGRADSYAIYDAETPSSQYDTRSISLIWFGGETQPRAFRDFRFFPATKRTKYTEQTLESRLLDRTKANRGKPLKTKQEVNPADAAPKPLWSSRWSAVKTCLAVVPPEKLVVGNVNTFKLERAILASSACGTLSQTIYVISKSRDRVLIAQASSM